MTRLKLRIPDMHCSSCAMKLEGIEDSLLGVARVRASYHRQSLEIEYDEEKVGKEEILAAVARLGYHTIPFSS